MNYIKNLILNGVPLGLFLYGIYAGIPWLVMTVVVLYWSLIVVSIVIMPKIPIEPLLSGDKKFGEFSAITDLVMKAFDKVYLGFNIIMDLAIAYILGYFGFPILAIFYAMHIAGYTMMYNNIKQFILKDFGVDSWGNIVKNLQKALLSGDTTFNFYKLSGKQDPAEQEEKLRNIR